MSSTIFANATLIDGTGQAAFNGHIRMENDRITEVSKDALKGASKTVDCTGKYLAPGFIDAHSHMDYFAATQNPEFFDSFTQQGITSFIAGNCGFSPCAAHVDGEHSHLLEDTLFSVPDGKSILCEDIELFQSTLDQSELKHNFYTMVGHGSYRTSISGFESRALTTAELDDLLGALETSLKNGAIGVSLGLQYKPGVFVGRDEILAVAKLVKKYDRILTVHAKAYSCMSGTYPPYMLFKPHNLQAIEDMISIAEETGVRLQYSHLIFVGQQTWKTMDKALTLFDEARARGVDICFDMFPYDCGATYLNTMLPDWFMDGMPGFATSKLARARLRFELAYGFRATGFNYDDMQITYAGSEKYAGVEGKTVSDIAAQFGQSKFDTLIDLLYQSGSQARVLFYKYYNPEIIERLMQHEAALFSTDAWPEVDGIQNPAAYGSFAKFLQTARDSKNISLEDCISKMTSRTAKRFNIHDRGELVEGMKADLVLFDWNAIKDNTNSQNHSAAPSGIEQVYVNGERIL